MISTRPLTFIISIVIFFVSRANSGNISSSSSKEEIEVEVEEVVKEVSSQVNSEHLRYCKLELTTPFQKAKPFDNFLHAFLYINTADFKITKLYTDAAYEYFYDLLTTAQDLNQPALESPRNYCKHNHKNQIERCLSGIEAIGCQRKDSGFVCAKKLYLDWKRDESVVSSVPYYGTKDLSDERLADAISRGINRFPDLSPEDLLRRLSDKNLLEDYYRENEDRRRQINYLKSVSDGYLQNLKDAIADDGRSPSRITRFNIGVANQNYDHHNEHYTRQRDNDLRGARFNCYGYNGVPYSTLLDEYNRRQNECKQLGDSYAMYLYNQIQLIGRNVELDSEEIKIFNDPEKFCVQFLLNNPVYYDWMYR